MPKTRIAVALFVLTVGSFVRGQLPGRVQSDANVRKYMTSLKSGRKTAEIRAAIIALHGLGKDAIPALINGIDDGSVARSSAMMFVDPIRSYLPPGSERDEPAGAIYAYVIELILARDTLRVDKECALRTDKECPFLMHMDDYAYSYGLITKKRQVIDAAELTHVKQSYARWWAKNSDKSLATLRSEWKNSMRPLTDSGYSWM